MFAYNLARVTTPLYNNPERRPAVGVEGEPGTGAAVHDNGNVPHLDILRGWNGEWGEQFSV